MNQSDIAKMKKACKEMLLRQHEPLGMKLADALRHFREECTPERILKLIALMSRLSK